MSSLDTDKARILVLGDSGVGKSSLVNLLCRNEVLKNPSWTIGCSVDVKMYDHKGKKYFFEFWDVGGSASHERSRKILYSNDIDGLLLVFDLSNNKSYQNLSKWLVDFLMENQPSSQTDLNDILQRSNPPNSGSVSLSIPSIVRSFSSSTQDLATLIGFLKCPCLLVGTKSDLAVFDSNLKQKNVTEELGCGPILEVNCLQSCVGGESLFKQMENFYQRILEPRVNVTTRHARKSFVPAALASLDMRSSDSLSSSKWSPFKESTKEY